MAEDLKKENTYAVDGLSAIIKDKDRVITAGIEEKYLTDTLGRQKGTAAALVFPLSTEEVSGVMRYAWERGIPVTPRGAGTNLVGSTVPTAGGIVLDLSRMNRILTIDENTMTAKVQAGTVLQEFQAEVESRGLFYPPDPGEKTATIGGNISTNAGGMRAVKYGVTRDYVRGLTVVLANGEILTLGSRNVKDASGLSLKNLIIGAEGTLAVITECILKLLPKPETSVSVLVPFDDLKTGIGCVLKVLKAGGNPTAVEFMENKVVELGERFLGLSFPVRAAAYILLTFDGSKAEIENNMERVKKAALANGAQGFHILRDEKTLQDVWKIRGVLVKAVESFSEQEPVDLVVPIDKTAEFISFVNDYEKKCGMQMVSFGHAGDGNVHLCIVRGERDEETWQQELRKNMEAIYGKAYELGGLTSGEHGIGIAKRHFYLQNTAEANLWAMRQIKKALDEKEILNPGKAYLA